VACTLTPFSRSRSPSHIRRCHWVAALGNRPQGFAPGASPLRRPRVAARASLDAPLGFLVVTRLLAVPESAPHTLGRATQRHNVALPTPPERGSVHRPARQPKDHLARRSDPPLFVRTRRTTRSSKDRGFHLHLMNLLAQQAGTRRSDPTRSDVDSGTQGQSPEGSFPLVPVRRRGDCSRGSKKRWMRLAEAGISSKRPPKSGASPAPIPKDGQLSRQPAQLGSGRARLPTVGSLPLFNQSRQRTPERVE